MQLQTKISGSSSRLRGTALQQRTASGTRGAAPRLAVQAFGTQAATRRLKPGQKAPKPPPPPPRKAAAAPAAGTVRIKPGTKLVGGGSTKKAPVPKPVGTTKVGGTRKVTAIEVFSSEKVFRQKLTGARPAPKVLSRIEQLKLLSKLEQSGLLSLAERNGLTLSKLEKSGLLSTAESLGLLSLVADRNFPGTLYTLASALLLAGPAAVYFLPDDSTGLVAVQAILALICVAGGSAAWGGATLLSSLQKS